MIKKRFPGRRLAIATAMLAVAASPPMSHGTGPKATAQHQPQVNLANVHYLKLDGELTVRTMIARNPNARQTVLFLHGFPETLYAWQGVTRALAADHEVHAFDWPGFGFSSRPPVERFSYSPRDYARVLRQYIDKAGINRSKLVIYATDIGALPALLAALEEPGLARTIIVGDFAPFNRPQFMHERLERLKSKPSADVARAQLNAGKDDTLENAFKRGVPPSAQFEISDEFKQDMERGWGKGQLTSADAFYHYYSNFTRDQNYFEANLERLKTPVKVIWGADDIYIRKEMGIELAERLRADLGLMPGIGHYPHLQAPGQTVGEIRAARPRAAPSINGEIK